MAKVLIVYHSQSGNTKAAAEVVGQGAKDVGGVEVAVSFVHHCHAWQLPALGQFQGLIEGHCLGMFQASGTSNAIAAIDIIIAHYGFHWLAGTAGRARRTCQRSKECLNESSRIVLLAFELGHIGPLRAD